MTPTDRFDRALLLALQALQFSASERIRIRAAIAAMSTQVSKEIALRNMQGINKRELEKLISAVNALVNDTINTAYNDETYAQFWRLMAVQAAVHIQPYTDDNIPFISPIGIAGLLIQGGTVAAWRIRTMRAMQFRIAAAIRQGVINGETAQQIITRVVGSQALAGATTDPQRIFTPGVIRQIAQENEALSNTIVQAILNDARVQTFQRLRSQLDGIQQLSVLDDRTTTVCRSYAFAKWTLDFVPIPPTVLPYNGGPPRHFNCRSLIIEILKNEATVDSPTFADWLNRQTQAAQDRILGPGRAQMWRSGRITLAQLVSGDGSPLTLAQLRALYP